ncbi:interleukin-1 alpha [Petaurus breviceps papuanus]|uniref:interleukin-1 alpha n=1 Tax=Petaurus breviceps papuanus TaxID=3040969 RepID=UPI0036DC4778
MTRVPDIYEELQSSYSENEGLISDIDQVSMSQESFYPSSSPRQKKDLAETSEKSYQLKFQEKTEKERRLSVSHPITNDYLVNIVSIPEDKDVKKYKSASLTFQKKTQYEFQSFITNQVLSDQLSRNIRRKENNLRSVPIQGVTPEELFDIGRYQTLAPAPNNGVAVTIKLSNTHLYVTAKKDMEPVELQEIPETPAKIDGSKSPFLFYWTESHSYSTFASVVNPELYLAASNTDSDLVLMAKGPPALIHFLVRDA